MRKTSTKKRTMTKGRRSIAGAKLLITAAAIASTFGGWAALASEQMQTTPAPPLAPETAITPNREVTQLREVDAPPVPIATTRSSR